MTTFPTTPDHTLTTPDNILTTPDHLLTTPDHFRKSLHNLHFQARLLTQG
jgi:hypothetical protein